MFHTLLEGVGDQKKSNEDQKSKSGVKQNEDQQIKARECGGGKARDFVSH